MFIGKSLRNSQLSRVFSRFSRGFSQYQEKCLQFEENWQSIVDEKNTELSRNLEETLTSAQKNYVDALAKAFVNLNIYEVQYFYDQTFENLKEIKGVPLMSLITDWPSVKKAEDGRYPVASASWFQQQEYLSKLWPGGIEEFAALFAGMQGSSGGSADISAKVSEETAGGDGESQEKAEETEKEKNSFEIELTAIDAAQKIKIIKEVRQLLGLGLKEAKDMVEKLPVSLKSDVKKEDAEVIKEKLTACGCTINLK